MLRSSLTIIGRVYGLLALGVAFAALTDQNAQASPAVPAHVTLPVASKDTVAQASKLLEGKKVEAAQAREALRILKNTPSAAAALVRARSFRILGDFRQASSELARLKKVKDTQALEPLLQLEAGFVAQRQGSLQPAIDAWLPLVEEGGAVAHAALEPLAEVLLEKNPRLLVEKFDRLEAALPPAVDNPNVRSRLLETLAKAYAKLGNMAAAQATRLKCYIEEPASIATPVSPPEGTHPSPEQKMARIDKLMAHFHNVRAMEELVALRDLSASLTCRQVFAIGSLQRTAHNYANAETNLTWVKNQCHDAAIVKQASLMRAKVISIQDGKEGLRSIAVIEEYAQTYAGDPSVSDVLFWAGDTFQRRGDTAKAQTYYERIAALPKTDNNQCAEARWRIGWMAYRVGNLPAAQKALSRLLVLDACVTAPGDQARASYWLGRISEQQNNPTQAVQYYKNVWNTFALGFYGQQALTRMLQLHQAQDLVAPLKSLRNPSHIPSMTLSTGWLAQQKAFQRGLAYIKAGLYEDAAAQLRTLKVPASAGFSNLPDTDFEKDQARFQATLLVDLLLDQAGAHKEAQGSLRRQFQGFFNRLPKREEIRVWRAAYSTPYRALIAKAERENRLPAYLAQTVAREESAFDAKAVSPSEAYGLMQLLLSTAHAIGKELKPPVSIVNGNQLLDPELNVRLGSALLKTSMRRYKGYIGLVLGAYNAGDTAAMGWGQQLAGKNSDIFAEEVTIQETRDYIKRNLKTRGIYLWLYTQALPTLAMDPRVPQL